MAVDLIPYDLIIVGGGPAGMAAAVAARESGLSNILLLERERFLGGVLPQCVHDGFGLHLYGRSLTGPEYAELWKDRAAALSVASEVETTVLSIAGPGDDGLFQIEAVGAALGGHAVLQARSVVVATGCRERTRGQLSVPGSRPAGVLTAGTAQYMVNVQNQLPGDKVVILGSGDIGLIMARRLTLEGADVRLVLGQEATGLLRNHVRCVSDFGIPILYGWGLVSIHGYGQLKGVTVAPLAADGTFDLARRRYVRCNVLLVACGLIPEQDILACCAAGPSEGLFMCGNASMPHDLADQVTQQGLLAGRAAAELVCSRTGASLRPLAEQTSRLLEVAVEEPKGRLDEITAYCAPGDGQIVVCTECPTGCVMQVDAKGRISGSTCKRGREFVRSEMACPKRLFTGTVRVSGADARLLPVRTSAEVPRDLLMIVARACRHLHAEAPVRMGDVVKTNVAGSGVDLVATQGVERVWRESAGGS